EQVTNDVFNVGTGRSLSIMDVAYTLAREIGIRIEPEVVGQYRAGDIRHCYADITKITKSLGYTPRVLFEDGMGELVANIREEPATDRVDAAYRELKARGLAR